MIAKTDSNHPKCQIVTRKRTVRSFTIDYRPAKRGRSNTVSGKSVDPIEQALHSIKLAHCNNIEKIAKLQRELDNRQSSNSADEKKVLEDEQRVLMNKIAALEMHLDIEKKKRDDEKKHFTDIYVALGNAKDKERKALEEERNALLQRNKALEMELEQEKQKHDNKKRALEEALNLWN